MDRNRVHVPPNPEPLGDEGINIDNPAPAEQAPRAPHAAPEVRRLTFKDIKSATEALLTTIPKFSGEKDDDTFVQWVERFVLEANALRLGRQLTLAVFPRLMTGSARLKYDGLTAEEKADFAILAQAMANKLRVNEGRDKAMNDLSQTKMRSNESIVKFAKRVENTARAAFPALKEEQRREIAINRFTRGLPSRIRSRVLERDTPETLDEAIELAEKIESIVKEEDIETINLINRVRGSEKTDEEDSLREQVRQLTIETKEQRRLIDQMSYCNRQSFQNERNQYPNRGNNSQQFGQRRGFQQQGYSNRGNFQSQRGQSNYDKGSNMNRNSYPREGWQSNQAPIQSGIHFLALVACKAMLIPAVGGQFQICPNLKSGEYFSPPPQITCELNPKETVVKTTIDIYTEFGASLKSRAYRCFQTTYSVCSGGPYQYLVGRPNIVNITTGPMTKENCLEAIDQRQVNNKTLIPRGNGIFHSEARKTAETTRATGVTCSEGVVYSIEIGEIATPDGEKVISSLGDMAGCEAKKGECETSDTRYVWNTEGITNFCKYSKIDTTEAYITKSKVAIPSLQIALEIAQNQTDSQIENCGLGMAVITNNGFMISIKNYRQSLSELIDSVDKRKQRMKRSLQIKYRPEGLLIQRLYGPDATIERYPIFSYDPIQDPRILQEMRKFDVTLAHVRFQWENYELPNKQLAILRAIREGEYRKQLIRELRENGENLRNAVTIKQLEQPSHNFDGYLEDEFGKARPLTEDEKSGKIRVWDDNRRSTQRPTTRIPFNREMAGPEFIKQIAEYHRKAEENRENSQLNGRLQFVADKIIEANYYEFDKIYHKLCEMQNWQIEISKTLLAIDPTLGMRTLLKRDDIVAKRAGMVYLVSQCTPVIVDKVFYDHNVDGKCYVDTPVLVKNQTWFIAAGMEKDLVRESVEIPCEQVTLGIYKNENGQWKSQNGLSVVRNIPITFVKKSDRLNLTLSAPPAFTKLENVENPFAYLASWTYTLFKVKETQRELMRSLHNEGMSFEIIEEALNTGIHGVNGIIQSGVDQATDFVQTQIWDRVKIVVIPILVITCLIFATIVLLKIYLVRKAAGLAFSELAKLTRRAPPTIQQMIRRWRPEVHNIMLKEDGATELDVFSIRRSDSIVSMPMIATILTHSGTQLPFIPVQLNGTPSVALLDSGASVSLIPEKVMRELSLEKQVTATQCSAKVANGSSLQFLGKTDIIVTMGKTSISHEILITENEGTPAVCLLGIDFISALNKQGETLTFNILEKNVKIGTHDENIAETTGGPMDQRRWKLELSRFNNCTNHGVPRLANQMQTEKRIGQLESEGSNNCSNHGDPRSANQRRAKNTQETNPNGHAAPTSMQSGTKKESLHSTPACRNLLVTNDESNKLF
ncbi:unnamed protein product [Caenorhabditis nigoni]